MSPSGAVCDASPLPAATSNEPVRRGRPNSLADVDWAFPTSTERLFTHDLHPWAAKFIPDIPATAIAALTQPGDTVLDPFCGCGTAAVEARAAGRAFVALDVNPLATLITQGKCEPPTVSERAEIRQWSSTLAVRTQTPYALPPIPNIEYWFSDEVAAQLATLLVAIDELKVCSAFLHTVFSSIIVRVSRQESETRYRRIERETSAAEVLEHFRRRLLIGLKMAEELERDMPTECTRTYITADARNFASLVQKASVQLAVFSPPYPNAFDYHLYHRFRMFWLGMDPRLVKHQEIGAHLRYEPKEQWGADMARVFADLAQAVMPGGYVLCVAGDGIVAGELVKSADILWRLAPETGLSPLWRTLRTVSAHRRAFNLSDTRLREEHILLFTR